MYSRRLTSPIPKDTKKALKLHNWQIDNIYLLLNRYLDFLLIEKCNLDLSECFIKEIKKINSKEYNEIRYRIEKILNFSTIKYINFYPLIKNKNSLKILEDIFKTEFRELDKNFKESLLKGLRIYRDFLIKNIKDGNVKENLNKVLKRQAEVSDKTIDLKIKRQLAVNLNFENLKKSYIEIDNIYGIPYIPSIVIKEVLKNYKILEMSNFDKKRFKDIKYRIEKNKPLNDTEDKIIEVFGNRYKNGKVIFLDSYPIDFEGFDIKKFFYKNKKFTYLLTLPSGTNFRFFFKNTDFYNGDIKKDLEESFKIL